MKEHVDACVDKVEAERQEKARQDANNAALEMDVDGADREGPEPTLALTDREVKSPVADPMDTDSPMPAAPVVTGQPPQSGSARDEAPVASGSGSPITSAPPPPPPESEPYVVSHGSFDSEGRFTAFATTRGYDEVTEYRSRGFCWNSQRCNCPRHQQEWQWYCCRDCKYYVGNQHTAECDRLFFLSQAADDNRQEEVQAAIDAATDMFNQRTSGSMVQ